MNYTKARKGHTIITTLHDGKAVSAIIMGWANRYGEPCNKDRADCALIDIGGIPFDYPMDMATWKEYIVIRRRE